MIYHNTPLTSSLQCPMQILQSKYARSDLPMSNVVKTTCLDPEQLRIKCKNEHLPLHDLHLGQDVMFKDTTSKQWFPASITGLCSESRSYKTTTKESVTYRRIQAHLNPYSPQNKKSEDEHCLSQSSSMQTVKSNHKMFNAVDNQLQSYSRPKRDITPPVKLDL